jgi:hypothetical protein
MVARDEKSQQNKSQNALNKYGVPFWYFSRSHLREKCCPMCEQVIKGHKFGDNFSDNFFGGDLRNDYSLFGNEVALHNTIVEISKISNPIYSYHELHDRFVERTLVLNAKLHLSSLFEKIFLRTLYYQFGKKGNEHKFRSTNLLYGAAMLYFASGDVLAATVNIDDFAKWNAESELISKLMVIVSETAHSEIKNFQKFIALNMLVCKIKSYLANPTLMNSNVFKGKNQAYDFLLQSLQTAEKELSENDFVSVTSSITEMVGKPGCGKSNSSKTLALILKALLPCCKIKDLIYYRANDFWWNGYSGQPIVVYDDFTHARKLKFDFVREIIDIGSGVMDKVPMAFVKDMEYRSIFTIITSNIPFLTKVPEASLDAVKRRLNSSVWYPRDGLADLVDNIYVYKQNGYLLNSITNGTMFCFDIYQDIFKKKRNLVRAYGNNFLEKEDYETTNFKLNYVEAKLQLNGELNMEDISTSSKLTSSVPESHSAIIEEVDPQNRGIVSALPEGVAQVNNLKDSTTDSIDNEFIAGDVTVEPSTSTGWIKKYRPW